MGNKKSVSTEEFDAALDHALFKAMTNGVPLMNRGEPVLTDSGKPIMVTPGADILGVAERRAKAKRIGSGTTGSADASNEAMRILAEATAKARSQGGDLPPAVDELMENERE